MVILGSFLKDQITLDIAEDTLSLSDWQAWEKWLSYLGHHFVW